MNLQQQNFESKYNTYIHNTFFYKNKLYKNIDPEKHLHIIFF